MKNTHKTASRVSNKSKAAGTHPTWIYGKLDSSTKIIEFIGEVPRLIYEGKISARTGGALNGAIRNLMTCYGLADYQRMHPQSSGYEREEAVCDFIAKMPGPLRREVLSYVDMRAREQTKQQNLQEEST